MFCTKIIILCVCIGNCCGLKFSWQCKWDEWYHWRMECCKRNIFCKPPERCSCDHDGFANVNIFISFPGVPHSVSHRFKCDMFGVPGTKIIRWLKLKLNTYPKTKNNNFRTLEIHPFWVTPILCRKPYTTDSPAIHTNRTFLAFL